MLFFTHRGWQQEGRGEWPGVRRAAGDHVGLGGGRGRRHCRGERLEHFLDPKATNSSKFPLKHHVRSDNASNQPQN